MDWKKIEIDIAPFDVHATMAQQLLGKFDPTGSRGTDWFEKVHLDPDGHPVVWRFVRTVRGVRIEVHGDLTGALERFVAQFPLADGYESFEPVHPLLDRLHGTLGLRLLRMPWTFDVAAGAVLQQRVRWQVGYTDFRRIAERWGVQTPHGVAFPTSTTVAGIPIYRLESMGIDAKRARALIGLARADVFSGFLRPGSDPEAMNRRLLSIRGIGPWTTGLIAGYASGDPDAVPVGDLHLPSLMTAALAGEEGGTDERMLELLEPWRGHRFRVIRLISWAMRRAPHLLRQLSGAHEAWKD